MRRSFETVLVGPSALVREGLTRILCAANFHIVDSVRCIDDADLSSLTQPILLIIDSGDDPGAAVEQVGRFKERHSAARIAMLADHYRIDHVVSALKAGADAYFVRVTNWDAFIKSLELVMLGETILPSALLPFVLNHDGRREDDAIGHDFGENAEAPQETEHDSTPHLSAREQCILHYLIEGHSNKAIARKINIAVATVKVHVKTILRKIRVQNRTQAAIWAINNGSLIGSTANGWSGPASIPIPSPHRPPVIPLHTEMPNGASSIAK